MKKEKVYHYVFKKSVYNDISIRQLIWKSTEILESFIVYHKMSDDKLIKAQIIAQYYFEKGLYKCANNKISEGKMIMENNIIQNADTHLKLFQLNTKYYEINSKNIRDNEFNLVNIIDSLSIFSIIELLKYGSVIHSFVKYGEKKIDNQLLDLIVDKLPDTKYLKIPQVRIHYNIYLVTTNDNENAFNYFIKDLKENEQLFTLQDLNDLYRLAINFCIKQHNHNKNEYTVYAFNLYLYAIDKGYLTINNEINRFIFTNIVALGVKLKEFNKSKDFIKKYANLVTKAFRKNTIDFNTAKIFYAESQFDKSLKILLTNEFKDTIWNINAKYLVLKIFIEKHDFETANIYLKAFKSYTKRKLDIGYHKTYFIRSKQCYNRIDKNL